MLSRGQQQAGLGVERDLQVKLCPRDLLIAGLQAQVNALAACREGRGAGR